MQTFLPYSSFSQSAKVLDYRRLGKQRVEAYQILRTLMGFSSGWKNHPATKMWKGYEWQLYLYSLTMCREWENRGYVNNLTSKLLELMTTEECKKYPNRIPSWLGDSKLHTSHQSNLIRKDSQFYTPVFGKEIPDNLPYFWPKGLDL